ncbi:Cys/Met metabolism PLP-dependent enzyme-domain-containing protein [Lipomyces tetrasporus]|uniref:Cys/Met metabolism PLP-dependent enzyme-domain-containing protein n=1 Tax=Lipomyces tetrasporus TaxID=54092 RepID=A0AAD7VQ19_9ASCO|nr:Cys/Met metabolism PLP-dependent enzyme-domain-containing protein [Lipomyces tetrasporus]KAJ8096685.1 Cys/Met metabolism PLP-dependent enzyme-domain-containing protein [Lipomyces tetrasporus]
MTANGLSDLDLRIASLSVHADDSYAMVSDVAPPLHVSTTYHYNSDPSKLKSAREHDIRIKTDESSFIYSRFGNPVVERVEAVLSAILNGHAVVYSSGLAAYTGSLAYYHPKRLSIGDGYHGCHGVAHIFTRFSGLEEVPLYDDSVSEGDLVHVETPINPTGQSVDLAKAVDFARSRGAKILVDATFAPPPLQDPFEFGVDMVMHSATKYLGGHSDLLAGVLVTKDPTVRDALLRDRGLLGGAPGNFEAWLLLRSLRTFKMRVETQAKNAGKIVAWLDTAIKNKEIPVLTKVYHSSLQTEEFVRKQLKTGLFGPTFSIEVESKDIARAVPSRLKLFHHATSLGGVESLIEWRAMTDASVSETLLRLSIGVEDADDLIADLKAALLSFSEN